MCSISSEVSEKNGLQDQQNWKIEQQPCSANYSAQTSNNKKVFVKRIYFYFGDATNFVAYIAKKK